MADAQPIRGMSKEEVAYNLCMDMIGERDRSFANKDKILDLYAECLSAASGYRTSRPTVS